MKSIKNTLSILMAAGGLLIPVCIVQGGSSSPDSTSATGSAPGAAADQAAILKQRQQLLTWLGVQLSAATPDQQQVVIDSFHQQMDILAASFQPAQLSPAQKDQQAAQVQADLQAQAQTLPAADLQIYNLRLQRQQLTQQLSAATPDQQPPLLAQLRQVMDQQDQAIQAKLAAQPAVAPAAPSTLTELAAAHAETVAAVWASLPADKQAELLAAERYRSAVFSALQLSSDQQRSALNAIIYPPDAATPPVSADSSPTDGPSGASVAAPVPPATTADTQDAPPAPTAPVPSSP